MLNPIEHSSTFTQKGGELTIRLTWIIETTISYEPEKGVEIQLVNQEIAASEYTSLGAVMRCHGNANIEQVSRKINGLGRAKLNPFIGANSFEVPPKHVPLFGNLQPYTSVIYTWRIVTATTAVGAITPLVCQLISILSHEERVVHWIGSLAVSDHETSFAPDIIHGEILHEHFYCYIATRSMLIKVELVVTD